MLQDTWNTCAKRHGSTWLQTFGLFLGLTLHVYKYFFYVNASDNASLPRKIMEDPCAGRVAQAVENGYSDVHPVGEVVMHTCKHAYMQTYVYTYVTYISLYLHTLSGTNMYTGYMYTYMHLLNTYTPVYLYIYIHIHITCMHECRQTCILA